MSGIPADLMAAVLDERDPGHLADLIAQNITLRHQDRQRILEQLHPVRRLMEVNEILAHETDVLSLERGDAAEGARARGAQSSATWCCASR